MIVAQVKKMGKKNLVLKVSFCYNLHSYNFSMLT